MTKEKTGHTNDFMKHATLCYLIKEKPGKQILLGLKKRGFGKGKLNGFGGKVKKNETVEQAALRELEEEIGIKASGIEKSGELNFFFSAVPKEKNWDQTVHIFVAKKWSGIPVETEEMKPLWFDAKTLPFEKMWKDDPHWFPLMLSGKSFKGKFVFGEDNESIVEFEVKELD